MPPVDILILSNGPGEILTWVRPVVQQLRQQMGYDRSTLRISVVLSPCPHATGKEVKIAQSYPEVDRVQAPEYFFPFLLFGKTAENWDWREKGVVVFLGGDQIFPVIIGKRLAYKTVVYAEWETRWQQWIDRFGVMNAKVLQKIPQKYANKVTIVGDLMAEVMNEVALLESHQIQGELVGLLPGSKPAKLMQGVPLLLSTAEKIHAVRPQTRFAIPVAPTLDLPTLAKFADPQQNPLISMFNWSSAHLKIPSDTQCEGPKLVTATGLEIELWTISPAYHLLAQCDICLTTVGANTAELGSLAIPMIVLIPTQQLDAMRAWDGVPGLLANLPGVGSVFAKMINSMVLSKKRLFAWPNIWAKSEIVPELVGKLQPEEIANQVIDFLNHPEKLQAMQERLRQVRGQTGAGFKFAKIITEEVKKLF
jgi:lipid A disaccharide synthetase